MKSNNVVDFAYPVDCTKYVVDSAYPLNCAKYVVDSLASIILFKENGLPTGGDSCLVHRRALLITIKDKIKKG